MWFWSVSWSTNCSVFFSFFLVDQKKIVQSQGIFGQSLGIFGTPKRNLVDQKFPETDQKFPETGQFFFGRPKKMRKRPNNWLTKRLTKTTWTGLFLLGLRSQKILGGNCYNSPLSTISKVTAVYCGEFKAG